MLFFVGWLSLSLFYICFQLAFGSPGVDYVADHRVGGNSTMTFRKGGGGRKVSKQS